MPKNNVNPDHYTARGRERQGDDVVHDMEKQDMAETQARFERRQANRPAIAESRIPKPGGRKA